VPGTRGQPHQILPAAGHFLQEDARAEFAEIVSAFAVNNR
jgi:haloalkane dehalogenase